MIIGVITALIQVISLLFFGRFVKSIKANKESEANNLNRVIFFLIASAYMLKVILQLVSAFPQINDQIIALKSFLIIGYIHLVTLGFVSSFLILLFLNFNLITLNKKPNSFGIKLFLFGVISTETILFTQGFFVWIYKISIPNYSEILFTLSSILLVGLSGIWIANLLKEKSNNKADQVKISETNMK